VGGTLPVKSRYAIVEAPGRRLMQACAVGDMRRNLAKLGAGTRNLNAPTTHRFSRCAAGCGMWRSRAPLPVLAARGVCPSRCIAVGPRSW